MSTLHAHVMKDGVGLRIWESSQVVEWTKHHSCPFMYSTDMCLLVNQVIEVLG